MPRPSAAYVHTDTYAYTNSTSTTLYTNELTPAATTTTTWPSSTTSPPLRSRNRRNSHSQSHSYTYQFNKSQAKHKRRRSTCEPPRNAKSHSRKRARTLTDSATGVGLVCRRTKRRRMDSALPSPSPTPPPRDTWAQYHQAVADGGIVMLSPADLSAYNPSSYAHRRECEAMDALWARPFDVRRLAKRWAGGVERASRQPDAVQRLSMRGCVTERGDEGSSLEEEDELAAVQQLRVGEEEAEEAHSEIESESEAFAPPSEPAEPQPSPEGPFWFAPPLVARYSRGAPYTLQRCRARQALSDLLRSPFDNRHFRLDENSTVRRSMLKDLGIDQLPEATTLAAGVPWSLLLAQWPAHADGLSVISGSPEHATLATLLRAMGPLGSVGSSGTSGSPMITSTEEAGSSEGEIMGSMEVSSGAGAGEDTAIPFFFIKDADTSSLADAKSALLVSMRTSLAVMLRLYEQATNAGPRAPALPDSAGQAFGLLQNGEAWELYMMHHRPASYAPYTVTRLWHGRMDVAVDVVTLQTLCANILASVDERVAFAVECLQTIYSSLRQPISASHEVEADALIPGIVVELDGPDALDASGRETPVIDDVSPGASAGASQRPPFAAMRSLGVADSSAGGSGVRSCITPSVEFNIGLYRAGELTVEDRYERISNWVSETSATCSGLYRLLSV